MNRGPRDPKPKQGDELLDTLKRIAGKFTDDDVDQAAVQRYRKAGQVDHAEVARLHRSDDPADKQTARLRAAAMVTALTGGDEDARA